MRFGKSGAARCGWRALATPRSDDRRRASLAITPRSGAASRDGKIGALGDGGPGFEINAQRFDLRATSGEGGLSQHQTEWRVRRLDRLDDGGGGADRIARLFAAVAAYHAIALARRGVVVGDPMLRLIGRPTRPIGAETARLDDQHLDAKRRGLLRQ